MINSIKEKYVSLAIILAGLLPLIYAACSYLPIDLGGDEVHSLKTYSMQGIAATVTNYFEPNNHVFFNIIISFALKFLGVHDLGGVIDNLVLLRSLQLVFGILTFVYVYLFAGRFIGSLAAILSVVFLSTTIPFLNFAMQLRGYSLSMLLAAALLFHVSCFAAKPGKFHAAMTALSAFMLFYTIPSNVYFIISLMVVIGLEYAARRFMKIPVAGEFSGKPALFGLLFISIGSLTGLLAYLPLLKQILTNSFITQTAGCRFFVLDSLFPGVSSMFLSGRFLLAALAAAGFGILAFRWLKTKVESEGVISFIRLALLYTIPFIVSFARNDLPFDRSFVMLAPVFVLLAASGITLFIASLPPLPNIGRIISIVTVLYCLVTFGWMMASIQEVLKNDIAAGIRHHDLLRIEYLSQLSTPCTDLKILAAAYQKEPCPVIIVGNVDRPSVYAYLDKLNIRNSYAILNFCRDSAHPQNVNFGLRVPDSIGTDHHSILVALPTAFFKNFDPSLSLDSPQLFTPLFIILHESNYLSGNGNCYVVTDCPSSLISILNRLSDQFHPVMLNSGTTYHTIFRISVPDHLDLRSD